MCCGGIGLAVGSSLLLVMLTSTCSWLLQDPKGRQWNRLKTAINQPDM